MREVKKPVHHAAAKPALSLPPQVISPAELGRLVNELKQIDENLLQLKIRSGGTPTKIVKATRLMELTAEHNKLNMLREGDRQQLIQFMAAAQQQAPRLHFSFGADPSPAFLEKLVTWLRREIHPMVLVTVGLQPNIGAGCIMRSSNHQFDFSLGKTFEQKRGLLLKQLTAA